MNYLEDYPAAHKSPIVSQILSQFFGTEIEIKPDLHRIDTSIVPQIPKKVIEENRDLMESLSVEETIQTTQNTTTQISQPKIIKTNPQPLIVKTGSNIYGYDKIISLLRNPQVQYVECEGKDTPLKVILRGQKQITNVILNEEDIKDILKKISEKTRIPLVEGVFKVVVDNFIFNAVISEAVGTMFIIKKFQQLPQINPQIKK